jgi:lipid A disaccharide synthetase
MKVKLKNTNHDPELVDALVDALDACEKNSSGPLCLEQLEGIGDPAEELRSEAKLIRKDLPQYLLKGSRAQLIGLAARLEICVECAQKITQARSEIEHVVQLISEFDERVIDMAAYNEEMLAQADFI